MYLINKEGVSKFAMDTDVSTTELNGVLSGLPDPSLDMLSRIATTKHISLDWLILGVEDAS
jgi:DNA-binding phage protein